MEREERAEMCGTRNSDIGSRDTHGKSQDRAEIKQRSKQHRHYYRWQIEDLEIQKC